MNPTITTNSPSNILDFLENEIRDISTMRAAC